MSEQDDLTRWNRSGLRRFRYVQGNAADYLEFLRIKLADYFPMLWTSIHIGQTAEAEEKIDSVAHRIRVLEQYHAERRDWAFEITRSFARACHVLTEHINAFANEGYIETTTQWDYLRRQVEMLGYHPAPPASASTILTLDAKPESNGIVKIGLQIKYSPVDGTSPVVFETLEDIVIDTRLNELRLIDWNRSKVQLTGSFNQQEQKTLWLKDEKMALSVGQPALLLQESTPQDGQAIAVELTSVNKETGAVCISSSGSSNSNNWQLGYTRLLAGAKKIYRPHLNGSGLVRLDRDRGLAEGDVIAWQVNQTWTFDSVTAVAANLLLLHNNSSIPTGVIYRSLLVLPVLNEIRTTLNMLAAVYRDVQGSLIALNITNDFTKKDKDGYFQLNNSSQHSSIYIITAETPQLGRVIPVTDSADTYVFDGSPSGLESGDWVLAEYKDSSGTPIRQAAQVKRIEERGQEFHVKLDASGEFPTRIPYQTLISQLRRVETILDQPTFRQLRLKELISGTIGEKKVNIIRGVGSSHAGKLENARLENIQKLANVSPNTIVSGIPSDLLREFRTRAEQLMQFGAETDAPNQLLDELLETIIAKENTSTSIQTSASTLTLERLYGPFRYTLYPLGYDRNDDPVEGKELVLEIATLPDVVKPGRLIVIEQKTDNGNIKARQAVVESISVNGTTTLHLSQPILPSEKFTYGNTIIRANAVRAGHGETKGERLLGSGNAVLLNQEFVLDLPHISFVADSTMPSGVRADIAVIVNQQIWQPVASLRDSRSTDFHYTVRMTEEGYLRIGFGDGQNGRRLPTGINNVRVRYRVGTGLVGNTAANSLDKLVRPHSLVKGVRQPLPAEGGNDMESVPALRDTAPASLLTLERAVSLIDYANLATSQSSIWQAHAFARSSSLGRQQNIEIVIVPANGATLDEKLNPIISPNFLAEQRAFLLRHAPYGIALTISPFEPVFINFTITVRIKSAEYNPPEVIERVRVVLLATFTLRRRRLGQALQRSEVYKVVEDVVGVENSDCDISFPDKGEMKMADRPHRVVEKDHSIQSIIPKPKQVIYLHPEHSFIKVNPEEYSL
jgi:hypothetical protein